jgi:NADH-quinone oxidoreductase subunit D
MPEGNEYQPDYFRQKRCNNMESLIYHFKIVMGEVPVPGEIYHPFAEMEIEVLFSYRWKGTPDYTRRPCHLLPGIS